MPAGAILFGIESIEEDHVAANGKLMYKFTFRAKDPAVIVGLPYYENCVIGSDSDPEVDDPDTWKASIGARVMKRIFKAAGIETADDLDEVIAAAVGQDVIAVIVQNTEPEKRRDGTPNEWAGRLRNNAVGWYAPGEKEIGLDSSNGAQAPAARPAAKKAPVAAQPAGRPVGRPAAAAVAAPAARPAAKPAPAAAKPAAKAEQSIKCGNCEQMIARSQYAAHVDECVPEE